MKGKDVIEAIEAAHGNLTKAAQVLGISRPTLYKRVAEDPKAQDALKSARESMKDMAESVLYDRVLAGEGWAVCFFLKTQAKDRKYVERQEVTGPEGGRIIIELDRGSESKSATESVPVPDIPV